VTQFVIKAREKQSPVGKAINKALSRGFFIPQQPLGAIKLLRGWGVSLLVGEKFLGYPAVRCSLCLPVRTWAVTGGWQQTCPAEIPVAKDGGYWHLKGLGVSCEVVNCHDALTAPTIKLSDTSHR